jgi:hypothetical protein
LIALGKRGVTVRVGDGKNARRGLVDRTEYERRHN